MLSKHHLLRSASVSLALLAGLSGPVLAQAYPIQAGQSPNCH